MSNLNQPQDSVNNADREETLPFSLPTWDPAATWSSCCGKGPHPESGELRQDLDAAQMFIDQLEMIEVKTKGNLTKQEEQLLNKA